MSPGRVFQACRGAVLAALWLTALTVLPRANRAEPPASFAGGKACAECHKAEADLWRGSHHAQAMQEATEATVLGDFNNASLDHFGMVSTFTRSDGKFHVRTDGPDGALQDFDIAYTFGVWPLQQYLIRMPGGRLQALGLAWDSRPKDQGGQRWFHLYPDQKLVSGDPLHWTGRDQTWNYQCASCHSTGLAKNFDLAANTYSTSWAEVNVSCETCHGPGSRHVDWARARAAGTAVTEPEHLGLTNWLRPADNGRWEMNPKTGIAKRTESLHSAEVDTCAACHGRRRVLTPDAQPGAPFLDSFAPAYLEPGLYHADGQIDGEVFEYGSFVQSRMFHAGVTCSNCHEPHSARLRAEGNALCGQCHMPAKFDVAAHHHHEPGSAGAQCIGCHMPAKTYMVEDLRRDHSFRVPRPDLTVSIGTPNTCAQCHPGRPAEWAARMLESWYPKGRQIQPHYGTALYAGRTGSSRAETLLDRWILDRDAPGIVRGSALLLLPRSKSPASDGAMLAALADPDPLVRAAAARALPASPAPAQVQQLAPLLSDPIRAVRIEAARALAGADSQAWTPEQRDAQTAAEKELVTAEMVDADRPEAHLNLGLFYLRRQRPVEAESEYRTALRLDPRFVPAMMNLADLDRMRGMDQDGAVLLRHALEIEPDNADVRYSLGLLLVRQHDYPEALAQLRRASELAPGNVHYGYVYAVGLNSTGASDQAIAVLERMNRQHPSDRDVLSALVSFTRDKGDLATALHYAHELVTLWPNDLGFRGMQQDLERRQGR